MGQTLPKAVESIVVKRRGGDAFRVGFAEMNGWRLTMEDANVIFMQASWGFFGVFDGHGGSECSAYVAQSLTEELGKCPGEPPKDDAAMKALALKVDAEFLETGQCSGSTGTFAIVTPQAGGRVQLRVGNIGDSRVLLGRADGTMVEGEGTDGGLTNDHKPNYPVERARIERNGGRVEEPQGGGPGVARVNGELAVSRAFGDRQFKETGGPEPEERPVTADPEFVTVECDPTDFIILVCDGISEGDFPNREVVKYAAEKLREGSQADPGAAAAAICKRALERNSRDNLSCMIVLLGGGEAAGPEAELLPGPVDSIGDDNFRKAYAAMAEHVGLSLAQAVELRYDMLQKLVAAPDCDRAATFEMEKFDVGPPEELGPAGSPTRLEWFERWITQMQSEGDDAALPLPPSLLQMLGGPSAAAQLAGQLGGAGADP